MYSFIDRKNHLLFITGVFFIFVVINILNYAGIVRDLSDLYINWFGAYFLFSATLFAHISKTGKLVLTGFIVMGVTSFIDGIDELSFILEDGFFDESEDFLSGYLNLAGMILISLGFLRNNISKEEKINNLRHSSLHDSLTGVFNRRALKQIYGCKEITDPVTFCYIDLDGFKDINDSYGHDTGDRILEEFAEIITRYKRGNDQFFRIGGDEFILVVDTLELEVVGNIIGRMNNIVKEEIADFMIDFTCGYVPISSPVTLEEVLKKADSVMYEIKQRKKNS